jgi:hypothetical protein
MSKQNLRSEMLMVNIVAAGFCVGKREQALSKSLSILRVRISRNSKSKADGSVELTKDLVLV